MFDYYLYHIVALSPALLYFLNVNPLIEKKISSLLVFLIGVFLCFGYMTGSDWSTYELVYENPSWHAFYEPAFVLIMNIGYLLDFNFFTFLIITKLCCYFIIVRMLRRYGREYFLLAFSFFISMFGLFLFIDNPLRNLLAIVVFLIAVKYFEEKKYKYYILLGIVSVSFHKSALLIFLIMPLLNLPFKKLYRVFLGISLIFIALGASGLFATIFSSIVDSIPFFNKFNDAYLEEDNEFIFRSTLNMKSILFVGLFALIILNQKYSKKQDQSFLYKLFLMYCLLFIVTLFVPIFDRFTFYFCVFGSVILVKHSSLFKPSTRLNYYIVFVLMIIINTHTMIMNKYVYLPYSNYLEYMYEDKPSYEYRLNYNYKYSPADKNEDKK
ncbi:EpsG family protein [Myroides sp. N17-2]|uniref:EpsG family protein n=1 Tax=Myroides sp. N17-2 TaxID=2030799 RepID=UPI000EFDACC1|nr:EpsG family protein [Myroides sp. N17-2]